jgi:2-methylcitrate dehydratase PrpD
VPNDDPTQVLATFVAGLRWSEIPPAVQVRVVDILIDAVACGLLGQSVGEIPQLARMQVELGGAGDTTVLGGHPSSAMAACLVNGYLITAATMCDAHLPTQCHVAPEVLPPSLAVAEARGSSGEDLLVAFAVGLEVTTRVGLALKPQTMRARGWHAPGVTGPFGGAAAAGRLMGLKPAQQAVALGLAGSEASGTFAQWGTMAVKFHQGSGAVSGLMAATLAEHGFSGCADILTNPVGGLLNTYSDGGDPGQITAGLGETWQLMQISLRSWPVAALMQSLVGAVVGVQSADNFDRDAIERVVISLSSKAYAMHGDMPWPDSFTARLSSRYIASVVLLDRACGLPQFSTERLESQDVNTFAKDLVDVVENPAAQEGETSVTVTLRDGTILDAVTDAPPGHPDSPLTRSDIERKFLSASQGLSLAGDPTALLAGLSNLESTRNVTALLAGLRLRR